jgi:hypothetical protein
LVADDLIQSVSEMLVEMGSVGGQRFAKEALIGFATQALEGSPRVGGRFCRKLDFYLIILAGSHWPAAVKSTA